jgi:restriction system protein
MTTNVLPTYDQLMQPTINALHALDGQATNQQIYEWVISRLNPPQDIQELPHKPGSSRTEIEYRMMWTRTYLRHFGLIDSPERGKWTLTELGKQTRQIDATAIVKTVKRLHKREKQGAKNENEPTTAEFGDVPLAQDSSHSPADAAISLTPDYPKYDDVRRFLQVLEGIAYTEYREMVNTIWAHVGSPQEQVDWTKPDEWIPARLDGDDASLAFKMWRASHQHINPRYTRGCWFFATRHQLLQRDSRDEIQTTTRGQEFIASPLGELEAKIDQYESIFLILRLIAEKGPARRRDLLDDYGHYCRTETTIQSESAIKDFLYSRLRNLIERRLIIVSGQQYEITASGLSYLKQYADYIPGTREQNEQQVDIHALAKQLRDNARSELQTYLLEMNPYKFESLVKLLLEEIGYNDVVTTSATNDKGVDVIANIQLGISSVREVVQVKRHKGAITRVVLDQLRGSLHRFDAVRGTIITTGHFSKGAQEAAFERGAAPITLIDGEKVLDLLMEHEIGIKKTPVYYYEFIPEDLVQFAEDDEDI